MSDRKYRQHGYQDDNRDRQRPASLRKPEPYDPRLPRDPKTPNLPGFRQAFRCGRCGAPNDADITADAACRACHVPLHACVHCASFDAGARFECREPIAARVAPKDTRNECARFAPRISVERETGSTPASSSGSARRAFDDLFKF
jgi:hypothetical protein